MTANRDIMSVALAAVYGPDNNLADWEAQHWVAEGFEPCGPGDKAAWYAAEGASGTSYGDLECDYWSNVYAGGGGGGVAPSNTVAPALDVSTLTAGGTVTVSDGTWTGDATITYTYQWQSSPTGTGSWTDISGATSDSLVSTETQVDTWVRCVVTGTNGVGNSSANSDTCAIQHVFTTLGGTWWIDAAREVAGGASTSTQWALNRGSTSVPHAGLGSSGRAELRGSYGLVLPGVSGNYASAPDAAALSITGDLDICADVTLVDWTPSANNVIACKGDASTQDSYYLRVNTSGSLELGVINAAGSYITGVSSVAPTVTDGAPLWVRGTVDIDNGANSVFKFYTSSDGSSWTQLGTTQTSTRITTSVRDGTSTLNVGCYVSGIQHLTGAIRRVIIKNGYDGAGSTVFDADFTAATAFATSFTESSSNAATVTINATSGADTNDPLLLPHTGTNYLYLPGLASNTATTSGLSQAAIGDVDMMMQLAPSNWTPVGASYGVRACEVMSASGGWRLNFSASTNRVGLSFRGTVDYVANAGYTLTNDAFTWVRATYQKSSGTIKFYTAAETTDGSLPVSWTQLGTDVAGFSGHQTGTVTGYEINPAATAWGGKVRNVKVYNGYDGAGSLVFDADFTANTNQSSFTESSANAATVTINRASTGRKSVMVTRPVWLFGADDYMEVADNDLLDPAAADSFSVVAILRRWGNGYTSGAGIIVGKQSAGGSTTGWRLGFDTIDVFAFSDGAVQSYQTQTKEAAGTLHLLGGVKDEAGDTVGVSKGSTITTATDITTGSMNSSTVMQIGRYANATSFYVDAELVAVAVFRSALSSSDLANIASYFGV